MRWCKHCAESHPTVCDDKGYICCTGCGKIIDHDVFSGDATFIKTAGGSQLAGNIVRSVMYACTASHERTLAKGREEIADLVRSLQIGGGEGIIKEAHAFYKIAVERSFTRGRRTVLVAASCLYIACRQQGKPYLLIDFSEYLQINIYVVGAVFLQLCQLLRLEEHPIVQKLVDPSLFIDRFTECLLKKRNVKVSKTALLIIASMKRDWMQTGRKPSGLCGAALYISALSHGISCSKSDIVKVVHICEATLTKRLIEFENTESGSLTMDEFVSKALELDGEQSRQEETFGPKTGGITEILCVHKGQKVAHFAHGLCRICYDDFITLSGGLKGGSEPPAFQQAEKHRMANALSEKPAKEGTDKDVLCENDGNTKDSSHKNSSENVENEAGASKQSEGVATANQSVEGATSDHTPKCPHVDTTERDESDNFSDIDDLEVDGYLHSEEEKHYKKIIWEEMNKEYLKEQAAKEAAAAEAEEAYQAARKNCPEDLAAQELVAATAAALAKSKKEKKQKRAEEAKNAGTPQTAAEATRQMLDRKRLSSKINYDVLQSLFEDTAVDKNKEVGIESNNRGVTKEQNKKQKSEPRTGSDAVENDQIETEYGLGDGEDGGGYDDLYYGNDDEYGYNEDYAGDY